MDWIYVKEILAWVSFQTIFRKNWIRATNCACFMTYILQKGIEHALQAVS